MGINKIFIFIELIILITIFWSILQRMLVTVKLHLSFEKFYINIAAGYFQLEPWNGVINDMN